MSLQEILLSGTGGLLVLLTIIQIAPIKVNPWSALAKMIGRAFNADVLNELSELKKQQKNTQKQLVSHIEMDGRNRADERRTNILRFNNELIRGLPHTREEFIEVLTDIDVYEQYCNEHPEYENNRAVHAIANIGRVYDERLKKNDFAQ